MFLSATIDLENKIIYPSKYYTVKEDRNLPLNAKADLNFARIDINFQMVTVT